MNWEKALQKILSILISLALAVLISVRIYAIYHSVTIRTWDDLGYRHYATEAADGVGTVSRGLQDILLPNGNILDNSRSIGYHSWIVAFLEARISGDPEQVFQWANTVLWVIQGGVTFKFAQWASQSRTFAGTLTVLYLACPLVFGLNRWVMTENFVMTGLLVLGYVPTALLESPSTLGSPPKVNGHREILWGMGGGWAMGLFGTIREYALPSYWLTLWATGASLFWQGRRDRAWGFTLVASVFGVTYLEGWIRLLGVSAFRVGQREYFHPLREWIPHFLIHSMGMPLAGFLAGVMGVGVMTVWPSRIAFGARVNRWQERFASVRFGMGLGAWGRRIYARLRQAGQSLTLIWWINLGLLGLYSLILLVSQSRQARAGVLILLALINGVLIGLRVCRVNPAQFTRPWFTLLAIATLLGTVYMGYYQLFVAYEGGKTFAHPAYDLEIYNYPLNLPVLTEDGAMHTR